MSPTQRVAWIFILALCCVGLAYWKAGFLE